MRRGRCSDCRGVSEWDRSVWPAPAAAQRSRDAAEDGSPRDRPREDRSSSIRSVGYVRAKYRCTGAGTLWVSVKQTADRTADPRLRPGGQQPDLGRLVRQPPRPGDVQWPVARQQLQGRPGRAITAGNTYGPLSKGKRLACSSACSTARPVDGDPGVRPELPQRRGSRSERSTHRHLARLLVGRERSAPAPVRDRRRMRPATGGYCVENVSCRRTWRTPSTWPASRRACRASRAADRRVRSSLTDSA